MYIPTITYTLLFDGFLSCNQTLLPELVLKTAVILVLLLFFHSKMLNCLATFNKRLC